MSEKKIVICDIDGTIANNDHRQHFLEGKKDWEGFFSELHKDEPIREIIFKVKDLEAQGNKIFFLTGRPEKYRDATIKWLNIYFSFEFSLLMRRNNDRKNKIEVKKELFKKNFSPSKIKLILENDEELIKLWRSFNLKVFKVQ